MGSTDQSESQALVSEESKERGRCQGRGHHRGTGKGRWRSQARGRTVRFFYCYQEGHIKRDCPKYKAQDQYSDTTATAVMAVDEDEIDVLLAASDDGKSDWILDLGSVYHLCKDREVFSTYAPCEGRIWMANNTSSRVVGRGSVRFCIADKRSVTLIEVRHVPNLRKNLISIGMLDSKGCSFDASGGTLRVSKGNKEMLWGKKTEGLYRLEEKVHKVSTGVLGGSVMVPRGSRAVQERREMLWDMYGSLARHEWARRCRSEPLLLSISSVAVFSPVVRTSEERWSHDNSQSDLLCDAPWRGYGAPQWGGAGHLGEKCYEGAGSEVLRKDNLKISDYPPVGWRGRLLSPAHLDESKPTWLSPSPITKPKADWSSYGVSM
ncbi:hypothetical protein Acr_05g0010890 [Actinidia rufa]|uniref:Retrovirus-related Pol polyprotein from transposon TNT 1-94-like beta-barrel domain-containing protein n=1 Tax=Actinidia rufa TaxID=165716 RepID=A0A7J0EM26_9ERIC|nr:hypothetical protein Acr_05g0010890 [Actinidia rufa]